MTACPPAFDRTVAVVPSRPVAFPGTVAAGWQWTPRPRRGTYLLQHPCGLSYEMPAAFAETASAEHVWIITGAMASSVQHATTSKQES